MEKIYTWNVNGIRAASKKGLIEWMNQSGGAALCLQETKAHPEQLDEELIQPKGYRSYWASADKKGYSGVVTYTQREPLSVNKLDIPEFDAEGRFLALEFEGYVLINSYFPNSQEAGKRLQYKLDYLNAVKAYADNIVEKGKHVLICGDYNIAHKPIDLANPKRNEKNPGYLPEERAWMDSFLEDGYLDCFRKFNQEPEQYTWWSYRFKAREKNIGWRIDYHCVNKDFEDAVVECEIHSAIHGSDHCPVSIVLKTS